MGVGTVFARLTALNDHILHTNLDLITNSRKICSVY